MGMLGGVVHNAGYSKVLGGGGGSGVKDDSDGRVSIVLRGGE